MSSIKRKDDAGNYGKFLLPEKPYVKPCYCNTDTYSVCIVVEDHQVAVADVETRQMVAGVLGVEDVFINHVRCSS